MNHKNQIWAQPVVLALWCLLGCNSTENTQAQKIELASSLDQMLDSAHISIEPGKAKITARKKVRYELREIDGTRRASILQTPTTSITFADIQLEENPRARFYIAIREQSWRKASDGVRFRLSVTFANRDQVVYDRFLDPKKNEEDRGWVHQEVSLAEFSGKKVGIVLRTDPGPNQNAAWDHSYWGEPEIISETTSPMALPNVILVSLDTLRADNLGAYGCTTGISQHIDAIASEGAVFENCISQSSWTRPSHFAMLASRYPGRNLLLYNEDDCAIPEGVVTLAEYLKLNKYLTAAFTGGGYVGKGSGFERGFDYFRSYGRRFESSLRPVLDWIEDHVHARFFLFLHNYNVHIPYEPPEDVRMRFAPSPPAACEGVTLSKREIGSAKFAKCQKDPGYASYMRGVYAAEVFNVDRLLGDVVAQVKRLGVFGRTIFIITSDHGEGLFDHGDPGHITTVYQELIQVPLIFAGPGVPPGRRIGKTVQVLDIAPTLLDLLDLKIPGEFQGRSLEPLLRGSELPQLHAFSASSWDKKYGLRMKKSHSITATVLHDGKKIIRNIGESVDESEFYDMGKDPQELTSLEGNDLLWGKKLDDFLNKRLRELSRQSDCEQTTMDPGRIEELKALGYLQ